MTISDYDYIFTHDTIITWWKEKIFFFCTKKNAIILAANVVKKERKREDETNDLRDISFGLNAILSAKMSSSGPFK